MTNIPLDKKLYSNVTKEAKSKFKKWPSAYASSWVVKQYKIRGGRYKENKGYKKTSSLSRWHKEEWIDVCELPRIVKCGRKSKQHRKNPGEPYDRSYPYCRPLNKISERTPKTVSEIDKQELKKRCKAKKKNPKKRIMS